MPNPPICNQCSTPNNVIKHFLSDCPKQPKLPKPSKQGNSSSSKLTRKTTLPQLPSSSETRFTGAALVLRLQQLVNLLLVAQLVRLIIDLQILVPSLQQLIDLLRRCLLLQAQLVAHHHTI